jgi:nitrogen regulatory protein PII
MRMVAIVFRQSLETEILAVLRACHVRSFTDIAAVLGSGASGAARDTFTEPGVNSIVFAALAEPDVDRVVTALRTFRDRAAVRRHGSAVPVHVFVLPCEQVF